MSSSTPTEPSAKLRNPFSLWTRCCGHLLQWISSMFGRTGNWIAKHPWFVIIITHLLVLFFSSGFIFFKFEKKTGKLYNPQNSQAEKDLKKASKHFQFDIRREMIIFTPYKQQSHIVLTKECLLDALRLHKAITNLPYYHDVCLKAPANNQCIAITPLELFDYNPSRMNNITTILSTVYQNKSNMMANSRPAYYNFPAMFGRTLKIDPADGTIKRADAFQMIYMMQDPVDVSTYNKVLLFEQEFLHMISNMKTRLKNVNVYYTAGRSIDDAVNESTMSDVSLFSITFLFMILFSCLAAGNCLKPTQGHALLATSCVIAVGYGIISGMGFCMWLGVPFVSIVGVLPFLVMGVGLDDMFIIVNEFDRLPRGLSVVQCVEVVMTRTGSSITMTTVTTLVAYLISTSTSFLAIRYFCLYATACIAFSYLLIVGFFIAALSIDARRIKSGRIDCMPCLMVPSERPLGEYSTPELDKENLKNNTRSHSLFSDKVMRLWARFLLKKPTKFVVLLVMLAMICGGAMAARNLDQRFDRALLAKPDSYFQEYLRKFDKYFSESLQVSIVVDQAIPYKWWKTQKELLKLSTIVAENQYYRNTPLSWIQAFKAWSRSRHMKTTGNNFLPGLRLFLSIPEFRHFKQDIILSPNRTKIIASRILAYTKSTKDTMAMCNAMVGIRNDLQSKTKLPAYAVTKDFLSFEHYLKTPSETLRNLMLSSVAIVLVTSVYLVHPAAIILVFINFVCLIVELLGALHVWSIPLNTLAMVGFVMAVGYSIDYSAHVAHAFMLAPHSITDERVTHALATVGSSVFCGGFSTFLGVIVIAFSESKLFQSLFRVLFSIVVLGTLHGLVFLPVLLSLFCPWKLNVNREPNHNTEVESESGIASGEDSDGDCDHIKYNNYLNMNCPCDFCKRYSEKNIGIDNPICLSYTITP